MRVTDKIESLIKKAENINFKAFEEGKRNFGRNIPEIEQTALKRAKICSSCDMNKPEAIEKFKVKDSIAEISERSCGACGCILPYLVRQNVKSCKLKKWL